MKKIYHLWYRFGSDDWKQKRLLMRQMPMKPDDEPVQEKEKKIEEEGEKKLKEFLGLAPSEANEEIEKTMDVSHKNIQEQIDNWVSAGVRSKVEWLAGRGILSKIGIVDPTQKRRLDSALERVAKEQAEKEAKEVFAEQADITSHATNSINILGHKLKACSDLVTSLNDEIQGLTKRQETVEKANKGLSKIKNLGARAYDFIKSQTYSSNSTLRGKIARMTKMRDEALKIKEEDEKKLDVKGEKNDQIKEWDENLRTLAAPYLKTEEDVNNYEKNLRKAILEGRVYENVFLHFIDKLQATNSEKAAMKNVFSNLIEGNARGNIWIGSRFEKFNLKTGGITKSDVKNYYLTKVAKFAKSNFRNNPEEKAEMLRKCRPGQEIQIGSDKFILMRNDGNGFLFRKRGDTQQISYLNAKNPKKLVLTIHKKEGESDAFERKEIQGKKSVNLDTIDFDYASEKGRSPKETTIAKSDKKEKKDRAKSLWAELQSI